MICAELDAHRRRPSQSNLPFYHGDNQSGRITHHATTVLTLTASSYTVRH